MADREITTHRVNGCNDGITIRALDEPGPGGANHAYQFTGFNTASNPSCPYMKLFGHAATDARLLFQKGAIKEVGVNGLTHEVLLAVVTDRLAAFQSGPFACFENEKALYHIREAIMWLTHRAEKRLARGVEGTLQV